MKNKILSLLVVLSCSCSALQTSVTISDAVQIQYAGPNQVLKQSLVELPIQMAVNVDVADCDNEDSVCSALTDDNVQLYSLINLTMTGPDQETTTLDDCNDSLGTFEEGEDQDVTVYCRVLFYPKESGVYTFSYEMRLSQLSPTNSSFGDDESLTEAEQLTFAVEVLDEDVPSEAFQINEFYSTTSDLPFEAYYTDFTTLDALEQTDWQDRQLIFGETVETFENTTVTGGDGNDYYAFIINGTTYQTPFVVTEDAAPGVLFEDGDSDGVSEIYFTTFTYRGTTLPDLELNQMEFAVTSYDVFIAELALVE